MSYDYDGNATQTNDIDQKPAHDRTAAVRHAGEHERHTSVAVAEDGGSASSSQMSMQENGEHPARISLFWRTFGSKRNWHPSLGRFSTGGDYSSRFFADPVTISHGAVTDAPTVNSSSVDAVTGRVRFSRPSALAAKRDIC